MKKIEIPDNEVPDFYRAAEELMRLVKRNELHVNSGVYFEDERGNKFAADQVYIDDDGDVIFKGE